MTDEIPTRGRCCPWFVLLGLGVSILLVSGIILVARMADSPPEEGNRPTAQAIDASIEETRNRIAWLRVSLGSGEWAARNRVSVTTAADGSGTRVLGPLRVDLLDIEFLIRGSDMDGQRKPAALDEIRATRETLWKGYTTNIEEVNSPRSEDAHVVMRLLDDVDNHLVKLLAIIRGPTPEHR